MRSLDNRNTRYLVQHSPNYDQATFLEQDNLEVSDQLLAMPFEHSLSSGPVNDIDNIVTTR